MSKSQLHRLNSLASQASIRQDLPIIHIILALQIAANVFPEPDRLFILDLYNGLFHKVLS